MGGSLTHNLRPRKRIDGQMYKLHQRRDNQTNRWPKSLQLLSRLFARMRSQAIASFAIMEAQTRVRRKIKAARRTGSQQTKNCNDSNIRKAAQMTELTFARQILNMVKSGVPVHQDRINWALTITGDLGRCESINDVAECAEPLKPTGEPNGIYQR